MNILLIVLTLLMILGSVAYSRLEVFRSQIVHQAEYTRYVSTLERAQYNHEQQKLYNLLAKSTDKNFRPQQLSLANILRVGKPEHQDQELITRQKELLKELIDILYQHASFFTDLQKKRPEFVSEIVDALVLGINQLVSASITPKNEILSEEDLAKVYLGDPELQEAYYLMLKGTMHRDTPNYDQERNHFPNLNEWEYYTLLDYITYNKQQLNINSAPPELLELYFDPQTVSEIVQARINKEDNLQSKYENRVKSGRKATDLS